MTQPPTAKATKRLDIQAMRALAVGAVVVFHLSSRLLPGGFTGVDVFFVISGYLMTTTILRQIYQEQVVGSTGRARASAVLRFLTGFYARRIRRLAPAALVTMAAVLLAVLATVQYYLQAQTAKQVFSSAIFMQNWTLARLAVDYLGATESGTAMQHFWSLSIEEQFYFVWPLLLLGAVGLRVVAVKLWGDRGTNSAIVIPLLMTAACFAYGVLLTRIDPAAAYFVTPARIWELSLGGIVALLPATSSQRLKLTLPWLGLAMCLAAMVFFDGTAFPGGGL